MFENLTNFQSQIWFFILVIMSGTLSVLYLKDIQYNHVDFMQNQTLEIGQIFSNDSKKPVFILWTQWRSGSKFIGGLIARTNPLTFYSYEPLHNLGVEIIQNHSSVKALEAVQHLQECINCDIDSKYFEKHFANNFVYEANPITGDIEDRSDTKILQYLCREKSVRHVIKVLRLALSFAEQFLLANDNVKIMYLVRDPRATIRSRKLMKFGKKNPKECLDPKRVCDYLTGDHHFISVLRKTFPQRFVAFRYEDFSQEPESYFRKVLEFLGEEFTSEAQNMLTIQTKSFQTQAHVFQWRNKSLYEDVVKIQQHCHKAMSLYGYKSYESEKEYLNIDPLFPASDIFL